MESGLPPGVFNVVPGYGHEAGEALALHMDVDARALRGRRALGGACSTIPAAAI
ncbi:MAG: aldehyde dehydrogenase family protein [Gammaproteobacteria bacterium]